MGQPHKWAKEIIAWANGAEIEVKDGLAWWECKYPDWGNEYAEYRIKSQPKEPQYLYVYTNTIALRFSPSKLEETDQQIYIGKIKLETDDE